MTWTSSPVESSEGGIPIWSGFIASELVNICWWLIYNIFKGISIKLGILAPVPFHSSRSSKMLIVAKQSPSSSTNRGLEEVMVMMMVMMMMVAWVEVRQWQSTGRHSSMPALPLPYCAHSFITWSAWSSSLIMPIVVDADHHLVILDWHFKCLIRLRSFIKSDTNALIAGNSVG